jgi:hypothetical protein
MASIFQPCEAVVTIEYPNGKVFSGKATAASVSLACPMIEVTAIDDVFASYWPALPEWTMDLEMRGTGPLTLTQEFVKQRVDGVVKTELEWHCPFCGRVNPAGTRQCGAGEWDGCGGARPFLYGILNNGHE